MTIVNHTSATHSGLLVTGSGDDIEIDVELIGGRTLRMSADGTELGAWPVEDCHIEEQSARDGSFRVVVDGDDAVFTPTDPEKFRALVQGWAGRNAIPDDEPVLASETDDGTGVQSEDAAADDPVAFLFGSSSPPVLAGEGEVLGFDAPEASDLEPVDAVPDHVPSVEEPARPQPDVFDDPDHDMVIDGGAVDSTAVETVDQVEEVDPVVAGVDLDPVEDTAFDDSALDDTRVDEIITAEPEPDLERDVAFEDDDPTIDGDGVVEEPDAGEGLRGRFGGSALERLSAAIGSITSNAEATAGDEEDPYELGPNTVAEDVLSTQRALRDHQLKDAVRGRRLKMAVWLVGIVSVVALFAFLTPRAMSFIQSYEGGAEPPPPLPVSATTVPTTATTVVAETDSPEAAPVSTVTGVGEVPTIFDRPAPEFVALWDSIAAPVAEALEFDAYPVLGPFEEQFTPYLSLVGVVEPQGTIEEFSLVVDPRGPGNYDRVGIQALGVAIATVDPEFSPGGRAALLGELGLNVRQPDLAGINGTVESGGIVYTLVYDEATSLLTLTVAPTG